MGENGCWVQVGMLFVRDRGGISHSPLEFVRDPDVAASVAAMYVYVLQNCLPSAPSHLPQPPSHVVVHEDL